MRVTPKDWAYFFVCVATWGSAYAIVRAALLDGAAPSVIVAARLWLATGLLSALLAHRRANGQEPPHQPGRRLKLAWLGLFGAAIPFYLLSWSQLHIDSGLAGILAAVTPILVAASAPLMGLDARLTAGRVIGIALGFLGVIVLMGPEALSGLGGAAFLGQLAATGAAVSYAVNTLVARAGAPIPPLAAAAGWTFWGALFATPFAVADLMAGGAPGLTGWIAIIALAVGPTGIASIAYFHLIHSAGPTFVTQTNYVVPLWAVAVGALVYGERLTPNAALALALIGLGLFVAQGGVALIRRRLAARSLSG